MSYKTILVDDEPLALQRLQRLLAPHRALIEVVATATDGAEALAQITAVQPDLVFLDIQMPELNGFQVLERLPDPPLVIFSTAYDEYALQAFATNAIDYLLKPVDPQRLQRAVEKLQRLTAADRHNWQQQLQRLLHTLPQPATTRLQVRLGERIRFLNVKDIYFLRAVDKYVEAHTFDEVFLLDQTLAQLETELPRTDFVRIHRSAIIHLNHLSEIRREFPGHYRARMRDKKQTVLPISRGAKAKLGLA